MNHRGEDIHKKVNDVELTISNVFGVEGILALSADVMSSLKLEITNPI